MLSPYPPVVPGLTQIGSGSETMQVLADLALMHKRKPSAVRDMLNRLARLFTPTEPLPEPGASGPQPDLGQAMASPLRQPPMFE